jgi:hypothetical protein
LRPLRILCGLCVLLKDWERREREGSAKGAENIVAIHPVFPYLQIINRSVSPIHSCYPKNRILLHLKSTLKPAYMKNKMALICGFALLGVFAWN